MDRDKVWKIIWQEKLMFVPVMFYNSGFIDELSLSFASTATSLQYNRTYLYRTCLFRKSPYLHL